MLMRMLGHLNSLWLDSHKDWTSPCSSFVGTPSQQELQNRLQGNPRLTASKKPIATTYAPS